MSYSNKSNRRKICFIYLHSSNRNVAVVFVKYILRHRYHVHVVYVDLSVKLVFFLCVTERKLEKNEFPHSVYIRSYSATSTTPLAIRKWNFTLARVSTK